MENLGNLTINCLKRIAIYGWLWLLCTTGWAQTALRTGVLVVGGGASGIAAGLQAARMGVPTIVAEPTGWLGGMITAAGVSAFDGNHNMPSGIWAEFREQLYQVYGGPNKVATGWVSNTLFEPHIGDSIFKSMAARQQGLQVLFQHRFVKPVQQGLAIKGAQFWDARRNAMVTIYAQQVIDATELGDVMAAAGVPYDVGMEASHLTGEDVKVPANSNIIQDLTYVAILKDYGPMADRTIAQPTGYDPMEFDGCCNEFCSKPEKLTSNVTAKKMLEYGKLPNGKYMVNWPGKGNDIYLNTIELTHEQREAELQKAKAKTMRFLYFLQTQFGFKNLDLADDEYATADRLPLIPYHRESRRMRGMVRLKVQHISKPFDQPEALYRTGVAVGDYPIDHHHRENEQAPQHLGFYPVPSFNFPLGALIPQRHNGLIVAEKSTSISNVVNGTTRLQPIVMLTGQAAGALAALAVKSKRQPRQVSVRKVQQALLDAKAYIMPYFDVKPGHRHFAAIQKIGATGLLRGVGQPFQWANRTWFYPDSLVNTADFLRDAQSFLGRQPNTQGWGKSLTINNTLQLMECMVNKENHIMHIDAEWWKRMGFGDYDGTRPITREQLAALMDFALKPFDKWIPDLNGHFNKRVNNQPKRIK
jgi:hypothetical protein